VPKISARGLTPVDWAGYLAQQRRWARSGHDIKFKLYPRLAGRLSPAVCLLGGLHGLYYLQGLTGMGGGGRPPGGPAPLDGRILVATPALGWTERWVFPAPYDP
jgi:hypothetical protein